MDNKERNEQINDLKEVLKIHVQAYQITNDKKDLEKAEETEEKIKHLERLAF